MATSRIELPEQLDAYIQFKIASGLYRNGAEVIRDALRRMMESDEEVTKVLRLQDAIALGFSQIAHGDRVEYVPGAMEELREQAREQARIGHNPKAEVMP